MKIKSIILSLCLVLSALFLSSPNTCNAESVKEKYSTCFSKIETGNVLVQSFTEADKDELSKLVSNTDRDMAKYLGNGFEQPDISEIINDDSDDIVKLTVINPEGIIVGQLVFSLEDNCNFVVTYWLGENFRGRGYMSSAVTTAIQKIWEKDDTIKFYFDIDDENIASRRTVEKVCANLGAHLEVSESHKVEWKIHRRDSFTYDWQAFEDDTAVGSYTIPKDHQILKHFPQESIDSGTLITVSFRQYVISK